MKNDNLAQIINAAYIVELRGIKLYEILQTKDEIFAQILDIKSKGLELLGKCEIAENTILQECFYENLDSQNLENCLIRAINYELEINSLYETLTNECNDENLRDICFRLWATSHNEYIPALKQRLFAEFSANKINYEKEEKQDDKCDDEKEQNFTSIFNQNSFEEISSVVQNLASGKGSQEDLIKLLKNPNFSFFSGLAAGGLAGILIDKMINQEENK